MLAALDAPLGAEVAAQLRPGHEEHGHAGSLLRSAYAALQRGAEDERETSLDEIYEIDGEIYGEIDGEDDGEVDGEVGDGRAPRERLLREGACLPALLRALRDA